MAANLHQLKFRFSEKATKLCTIFLMDLNIYLVNVQIMRKGVQIFVVFLEKLKFSSYYFVH